MLLYLIIVPIAIIIGIRWVFNTSNYFDSMPGPEVSKWPFVGNLDLLWAKDMPITESLLRCQKKLCNQFANLGYFKFSSIFSAEVHVFRADTVQVILSSNVNTTKADLYQVFNRWLGQGLVMSSGLKWKQDRKLLTNAFHFKTLDNFVPVINENATNLVNFFRAKVSVNDVKHDLKNCTLDILCETSLGVHYSFLINDNNDYPKLIEQYFDLVMKRLFNPFLYYNEFIYYLTANGRKELALVEKMNKFTRDIYDSKKREKIDQLSKNSTDESTKTKDKKRLCLLDLLLSHQLEDNLMTDQDVLDQINTFTFAGHDTTGTTLTFAVWYLARHQHVRDRLYQEVDDNFGGEDQLNVTQDSLKNMNYLDCFIKEVLRLCPPANMMARQLDTDIMIAKHRVPAGTRIWVNLMGLHRDPEVFPEPSKFDPERFDKGSRNLHPFAYTPFSGGPRNCIGFRLALTKMKIILIHLINSFDIQFIEHQDKMVFANEGILQPKYNVSVKFIERV